MVGDAAEKKAGYEFVGENMEFDSSTFAEVIEFNARSAKKHGLR